MGTEPRTDTGSSPEEPSGRTTGNKYFKEYMRLVHVSLRSWWWGEPLAATLGLSFPDYLAILRGSQP